jgi:hypothetical protein
MFDMKEVYPGRRSCGDCHEKGDYDKPDSEG